MSVDITRLSRGLAPTQQQFVRATYSARAKNPTTAFLLCFFLGIFGAHRFYLGQTGQGVVRVILVPLIVPGLIWEILDLFRIDGEVYERNLKLAEELVARAALAQPNVALEAEAVALLDAAVRAEEAVERPDAPDSPMADDTGAAMSVPLMASMPDTNIHASDATDAIPQEPATTITATERAADAWDLALSPQQPGLAAEPPLSDAGAEEAAVRDIPTAAPEERAPDAWEYADLTVRSARFDPTEGAGDSGSPPPVADIGEGVGQPVHVALAEPAADAYDAEIAGAASWAAPLPPPLSSPAPWPDAEASLPLGASAAADDGASEVEEAPTLIFYPDDAGDPLTIAAPADMPPDAPPIVSAHLDDMAPDALLSTGADGTSLPELDDAAPASEPVEGARRLVKRVRVVRRLVVNGQVVQETSAEQVVDPEADTATTAAALRESLGTVDSETLAEFATPPALETLPGAGGSPPGAAGANE
jgi:TM2 domain-containing membrane protein YozV